MAEETKAVGTVLGRVERTLTTARLPEGTPNHSPELLQRLIPDMSRNYTIIAEIPLKPICLCLILLILVTDFIIFRAVTSVLYKFIDIS